MGGQGSGRPPLPENLLRPAERPIMPAESFIIPNYSGLQPVKKTDPAIGTGGVETDPIFIATSGSFVRTETDPVFMALSGSLVATETDPIFIATSGSFVKTETDPVFIATSGSFIQTETDPVFMALSGSIPAGTETDPLWTAASGSYAKLSGSTEISNTYVGYKAGDSSTGKQNTFVGSGSGLGTTGSYNCFIGYEAGNNVTQGNGQFIGTRAGTRNIGGECNAIGWYAGYNNAGGYLNAIGYKAGYNNSGSNVIAIGANAGDHNSGSNVIAIGANAGYYNSNPNQLIIRSLTAETYPLIQGNFISGSVGIGKQYAKANLDVSGSILASGNISGSSINVGTASVLTAETDPVYAATSGSLPFIPMTLSGSWNTDLASGSAHFYDASNPHGDPLQQTNIHGTFYSGSNILVTNTLSGSTTLQITPGDHGYSGSAMVVGVIYNTSDGFPAANTTPEGTLAITYTA